MHSIFQLVVIIFCLHLCCFSFNPDDNILFTSASRAQKKPKNSQPKVKSCPRGFVLSPTNSCRLCPAGKYQPYENHKLSTCLDCPYGTVSSQPGIIFPWLCHPCGSKAIPNSSQTGCKPCKPGYLATHDHISCIRCKPGTYFDGLQCEYCSSLTVSTKYNARSCFDCPFGYGSKIYGNGCVKKSCRAGSIFWSHPGYCISCESGSIRRSANSPHKCIKCPNRMISINNNTKCVRCKPGTRLANLVTRVDISETTYCEKCPAGTTTYGYSKAFCINKKKKKCPHPKAFIDKNGDCDLCAPNEYHDVLSSTCRLCKKNSWSFGGRIKKCNKCAPGQKPTAKIWSQTPCECASGFITTKSNNGVITCKKCPAGTFKASENYCRKCEENEYSGSGAMVCKTCPTGTLSKQGTQCIKRRKKCPNGYILPPLYNYYWNSRYDICVSRKTGCPKGMINIRKDWSSQYEAPICAVKSKNNTLVVKCRPGTIYNGNEYCTSCSTGQYLIVEKKQGQTIGKCRSCGSNSVSLGGLSKICKKCPPGYEADGDKCYCGYDKTVEASGRCTFKCNSPNPIDRPRDCHGTTILYPYN